MSNKQMQISAKGLWELMSHEGVVLAGYLDSVGVWTTGIGMTGEEADVQRKDTRRWSNAKQEEELHRIFIRFDQTVDKYEARVNQAISVPLKQHEFDALVSFDYNTGGIFRAKLTQQINSGDKSGDGFMGWLKPPQIRARRVAEQKLFREGIYSAEAKGIPIYDALGDGGIKFNRLLSTQEAQKIWRQTKPVLTTERRAKPQQGWEYILRLLLRMLVKLFGG